MIFAKRLDKKLCTGLNLNEFECRCNYQGCVSTKISPKLINSYKRFRELVGVPLIINSGFRCEQHNKDVGSTSKASKHLTGCAIDISLKTVNHLSSEEIEHAAKVAGFKFIKFYKTFFHADTREND